MKDLPDSRTIPGTITGSNMDPRMFGIIYKRFGFIIFIQFRSIHQCNTLTQKSSVRNNYLTLEDVFASRNEDQKPQKVLIGANDIKRIIYERFGVKVFVKL